MSSNRAFTCLEGLRRSCDFLKLPDLSLAREATIAAGIGVAWILTVVSMKAEQTVRDNRRLSDKASLSRPHRSTPWPSPSNRRVTLPERACAEARQGDRSSLRARYLPSRTTSGGRHRGCRICSCSLRRPERRDDAYRGRIALRQNEGGR